VALPKGRATPSAVRAVWGVNGHRDPLLIDARPTELERNLVTSNLDQRSCSALSDRSVSGCGCLTAGVGLRNTLASNWSGGRARGVRPAKSEAEGAAYVGSCGTVRGRSGECRCGDSRGSGLCRFGQCAARACGREVADARGSPVGRAARGGDGMRKGDAAMNAGQPRNAGRRSSVEFYEVGGEITLSHYERARLPWRGLSAAANVSNALGVQPGGGPRRSRQSVFHGTRSLLLRAIRGTCWGSVARARTPRATSRGVRSGHE
jgi:hypothetical protein